MKNLKLLAMLFMASLFSMNVAHASEHHSGHNMANDGGGGSGGCSKPKMSKFLPANLATVPPGSGFSFIVSDIESDKQLNVVVKKIPVKVEAEFKDPYYVVKGKLPAELVNTVARIDIKVTAKSAHCEGEKGWLVKISEK